MIYDDDIKQLYLSIKYKVSKIEKYQMALNVLWEKTKTGAMIEMKIRATERKQRAARKLIDKWKEEIRQLKALQNEAA